MSAGALPHQPHDHAPCMRAALTTAEALARRRGARLTPQRKAVLEIIVESHRPMGAYDILQALAERQSSVRRPAPPTVYRALDFLLQEGFVHRVDSLNAYVACFAPARHHASHFLICRSCGCAAEIEHGALDAALADAAHAAGFAVERETVELTGLCASCAEKLRKPSTPSPAP